MTTAATGVDQANRLLAWLVELPVGAPLPPMVEIGRTLHFVGSAPAYQVCNAFDRLVAWGRIVSVHGTRNAARGHRIVRLPSGRTHATVGCPLVLP